MPQAQSNTAALALTAADYADFIDESDLLIRVIRAIRGRLFFPKLVSISVHSWLDPAFPRTVLKPRISS